MRTLTKIRDDVSGSWRRPRILLADDHRIVVESMRRLLGTAYDLLPAVGDGQVLIETAIRTGPDIIIADISMPMVNGIEAARQIKSRGVKSKIIVQSMHAETEWATQAFAAGASGYVLKQSAAEELRPAIERVLRNKTYISPRVARDRRQISQRVA